MNGILSHGRWRWLYWFGLILPGLPIAQVGQDRLLSDNRPSVIDTKTEICLRTQPESGRVRIYPVEGYLVDGAELNQVTGNEGEFNNFSTYAVVFWDYGSETVFEMPGHTLGGWPLSPIDVVDQFGDNWKLERGVIACLDSYY